VSLIVPDWERTLNADLLPDDSPVPDGARAAYAYIARSVGCTGYVVTEPTGYEHGPATARFWYSATIGSYHYDRPAMVVETPAPVVDAEHNRMTVAVTFEWRRPWALDHCTAGEVVGLTRRAVAGTFRDHDLVAGIADVVCFEPREERALGRVAGSPGTPRPVPFPDPQETP